MKKELKLLIEVMDLEQPKVHSLEVADYKFVEGVGIVIERVNVLDKDGICFKKAELDKLVNHLDKYPIKFKKR